ncbi:MAG: MMPL family transporter [Pseudomonadota bacterium]
MASNGVAAVIAAHPVKLVLACFVLTAMLLTGIGRISVETDYDIYFDGASERLQAFREVETLFGRQDTARIAIRPQSGDVRDREFIELLRTTTDELWRTPYVSRVESLSNAQYVRGSEFGIETEDLFGDPLSMPEQQWRERWDYALTDLILLNGLVNEDASFVAVAMTVELPEDTTAAYAAIVEALEAVETRIEAEYPADVFITGSVPINNAFFEEATSGLMLLLLIALAVMLGLILLLFRSIVACLAAAMCMTLSVLSALGASGYLGLPFTAPSSAALIITLILSAVMSIHLITAYARANTGEKVDRRVIVRGVTDKTLTPVFLASFTSAIGFLCLQVGAVPPYRYMGVLASLGIVFGFVFNYALLLSLLALAARRRPQQSSDENVDGGWNNALAGILVRHRSIFAGIAVVATLVLSVFTATLEADDNLVRYFSKDAKIRADTQVIMDNLSPVYRFHVSLNSGEPSGINDISYLEALDEFTAWLRAQPEVMKVWSYIDVVKQVNREINDGDPNAYRLPDTREAAAQTLLVYELSLPFGADINNQIDSLRQSSRIIVGFHDIKNSALRDFERRTLEWRRRNLPDGITAIPTGPNLMFAHIWRDGLVGNLTGLALAVALISLVVAASLQDFRLGLLSLLPNIAPVLAGLGVWAIIFGFIDIGTSIVAVIAFGVIVDDTIHILINYKRNREASQFAGDPEGAMRRALAAVLPALTNTTIILICGLLVLSVSPLVLNSSIGILTSVIIALAWLFDFTLLPALLLATERRATAPTFEEHAGFVK